MNAKRTTILGVAVCIALTRVAFSVTAAEAPKLTVENVLALKGLGFSDEVILERITDSATIFADEDINKLKAGGFGDEFIAKLPKPETPTEEERKLTVENVLALKQLGIAEQSILEKVQSSGTTFTPEEVQKLKDGGMSEDFLGKLAPQERIEPPEVDLEAAREKLRTTATELKNLVDAADAAMEQFDKSAKKLESFREAGVVSQEAFVEGMDKAAQNQVAASDERVAKARELEEAVAASPSLPEKNAATEMASRVLEYLEALRKTRELAVAVAKGEQEKSELDSSRTAAGDVRTKLSASHNRYLTAAKKKTKDDLASDRRTGTWHLDAAGATVDLELRADGTYTWHYKAGDEVEDLQGTWKRVDDSAIQVIEKGSRGKTLVPCKLTDQDTLQITLQGVVFHFKRK